MSNKDYGVIKRVVVTPDKHFPLHDQKAINVLKKTIEIVKPDAYIDLGDVGEWNAFSAWRFKRRKAPPLEYLIEDFKKDIKDVNSGMDMVDESLDKVNCNEKYITEGNHDNWLNMAVEKYPYIPQYKFKNAVNLADRGYVYYPMGKFLKLGKLFFYHGHQFGGQYHAANHLRKKGCNVMYGHWHDLQQHSVTHHDGAKSAWSIGCLKDMSPKANDWLQYRDVNWAHAFAIVDFFEKGLFTVHVIQIINGKTCLWGEVIKG
jgi:metallophosphoesterase superfamily enzyme